MAREQNPDRKYDDKKRKLAADGAAALARAKEQADLDVAEKARIKSAQSVNKKEQIDMGADALARAQAQADLDKIEKDKIKAAQGVMAAATNAGWEGGAVNNPDGDPEVDETDRNPNKGKIPKNPYIETGPVKKVEGDSDEDFDGTIASLTAMLAKYDMVGIVAEIKRIRKKYPQIKSDDILTMVQFDSEYNKPYLARFAGNAELMKKGKRTLTMGEYLSNEQAYEKVFKAYSVKNFSDRTSYAKLIAGEVSPAEAGDRVNLGYTRVLGDKDTLESFKKYYSALSTGDIVGAFLDPENQLPALQKKVTAAEIGGAATARAFALSEEEAMNLGSAYGVDKAEAQKGFSDIGMMSELGQALPGDISGKVTSDEMLGVTFKDDAEAKKKLRKVATTRTAEFEAGGEFAASQTGVSGLGSATRGT